MSATTMLPTYDAQMMDYPNDIDVPMHSSASESWYLGDLVMEDDPETQHKADVADQSIPTIEVDMEDWAPEPVEYEMADDADVPYEGGAPVDVEVYDVSQITSQIHSPSGLTATQALPEHIPAQSHTVSPSFSPSIEVPMLPESHKLQIIDERHEDEPSEVRDNPLYSSIIDPPEANFSTVETQQATSDNLLTDELQPVVALDNTDHHEPADGDAASTSPSLQTHDLHPALPVSDEDEVAVLVNHNPEQVQEPSRDAAEEEFVETQEEQDSRPTSADPHEISEGVYIDPPPAVLLSLSLPDEGLELPLFNRPPLRASSSSAGSHHEQFDILLHEKPTLYYEPLTSVFDALRQEQEIARIPDMANGELVLDAYDLDLSISEDNVYAREISIHDLNVLHDGSKFSGPLRVYLRAVTPRFIFRYHELQYLIAHSNQVGNTSHSERHDLDDQHEEVGQNEEPADEGEVLHDHTREQPEQDGKDQPPQETESAHEEAFIGDISNPSSELPENQEQPVENKDVAEAQRDSADGDAYEPEAEVENELDDSLSTVVNPGTSPTTLDFVEPDETNQDVASEYHAGGEHQSADDQDEVERGHSEEERTESDDHLDVHGSSSYAQESDKQDNDAPATQGLSEAHSVEFTEINAVGLLDRGEHEVVELEVQSNYNSVDVLGENDYTSIHGSYIEQEPLNLDEISTSETPAVAGADYFVVGHPEFDRTADYTEDFEDNWDDADALNGQEYNDDWGTEHDAQSNESSVTLSSSASKRTYGQVDVDDEHDDGSGSPLLSLSHSKRLRSR